MSRVVLDTNVLVSALITPAGASAQLLVELRAGSFELIVSPRVLDELGDVLSRAKIRRYASWAEAEAYVALLHSVANARPDPAPSARPVGPDPDDEYLIDLARATRADALVSGDRHLLELRDALPIISPADFVALLRGR